MRSVANVDPSELPDLVRELAKNAAELQLHEDAIAQLSDLTREVEAAQAQQAG